MSPNIGITVGLMLAICLLFIHAIGMYIVAHKLEAGRVKNVKNERVHQQKGMYSAVALIVFLTHAIEVLLIATVLLVIQALPNIFSAFYFTIESYTAFGFGEILLPSGMTKLALFIAISGLFSLGWTSGVIVNIVRKTYYE